MLRATDAVDISVTHLPASPGKQGYNRAGRSREAEEAERAIAVTSESCRKGMRNQSNNQIATIP